MKTRVITGLIIGLLGVLALSLTGKAAAKEEPTMTLGEVMVKMRARPLPPDSWRGVMIKVEITGQKRSAQQASRVPPRQWTMFSVAVQGNSKRTTKSEIAVRADGKQETTSVYDSLFDGEFSYQYSSWADHKEGNVQQIGGHDRYSLQRERLFWEVVSPGFKPYKIYSRNRLLKLIEQNGELEPQLQKFNDVDCYAITYQDGWKSRRRILVDPTRGYCIVKEQVFRAESGTLASEQFVTDLRHPPGRDDVWIAFGKARRSYVKGGDAKNEPELKMAFTYTLKEFEIDPELPEDHFRITTFPEGTWVDDRVQHKVYTATGQDDLP